MTSAITPRSSSSVSCAITDHDSAHTSVKERSKGSEDADQELRTISPNALVVQILYIPGTILELDAWRGRRRACCLGPVV